MPYGTMELLGIDPRKLKLRFGPPGKKYSKELTASDRVIITYNGEEITGFAEFLKKLCSEKTIYSLRVPTPIISAITIDFIQALTERTKENTPEGKQAHEAVLALKNQLFPTLFSSINPNLIPAEEIEERIDPLSGIPIPGQNIPERNLIGYRKFVDQIAKGFLNNKDGTHPYPQIPENTPLIDKPGILLICSMKTDVLIDLFNRSIPNVKIMEQGKEYVGLRAFFVLLKSKKDLTPKQALNAINVIKKHGGAIGKAEYELIQGALENAYKQLQLFAMQASAHISNGDDKAENEKKEAQKSINIARNEFISIHRDLKNLLTEQSGSLSDPLSGKKEANLAFDLFQKVEKQFDTLFPPTLNNPNTAEDVVAPPTPPPNKPASPISTDPASKKPIEMVIIEYSEEIYKGTLSKKEHILPLKQLINSIETLQIVEGIKEKPLKPLKIKLPDRGKIYSGYKAYLFVLNENTAELTLKQLTEVVTSVKQNKGHLGKLGYNIIEKTLQSHLRKLAQLTYQHNTEEQLNVLKQEFNEVSAILKGYLTKNSDLNPSDIVEKHPGAKRAFEIFTLVERQIEAIKPVGTPLPPIKENLAKKVKRDEPSEQQPPTIVALTVPDKTSEPTMPTPIIPRKNSTSFPLHGFKKQQSGFEHLKKLASNHVTGISPILNQQDYIRSNEICYKHIEQMTNNHANTPPLYKGVKITMKNNFNTIKLDIPHPENPNHIDTLSRSYEEQRAKIRISSPPSDKAIMIMFDTNKGMPLKISHPCGPEIAMRFLHAAKLTGTSLILNPTDEQLLKNSPFKEQYEILKNMSETDIKQLREHAIQTPNIKLGDPMPAFKRDIPPSNTPRHS